MFSLYCCRGRPLVAVPQVATERAILKQGWPRRALERGSERWTATLKHLPGTSWQEEEQSEERWRWVLAMSWETNWPHCMSRALNFPDSTCWGDASRKRQASRGVGRFTSRFRLPASSLPARDADADDDGDGERTDWGGDAVVVDRGQEADVGLVGGALEGVVQVVARPVERPVLQRPGSSGGCWRRGMGGGGP